MIWVSWREFEFHGARHVVPSLWSRGLISFYLFFRLDRSRCGRFFLLLLITQSCIPVALFGCWFGSYPRMRKLHLDLVFVIIFFPHSLLIFYCSSLGCVVPTACRYRYHYTYVVPYSHITISNQVLSFSPYRLGWVIDCTNKRSPHTCTNSTSAPTAILLV